VIEAYEEAKVKGLEATSTGERMSDYGSYRRAANRTSTFKKVAESGRKERHNNPRRNRAVFIDTRTCTPERFAASASAGDSISPVSWKMAG